MFRRTAADRKAEAARARQITEDTLAIYGGRISEVSLEVCDYDKSRKVLKLTSDFIGMPSEFFVKSHHTGKVVRFTPVGEYDKLFDQDQWDGEQQIYRPIGNVPGVDHFVIFNAY